MRNIVFIILLAALTACGSNKKTAETQADTAQTVITPEFNADSAYVYCERQCDFGPRVMNSIAHDKCGEWIANTFKSLGCEVTEQKVTLTAYDGTKLKSNNIIASYRPDMTRRVLLCAHWDSRPWADNDPDSANWRKPVMGANDGASGVAVMMEIARLLKNDTTDIGIGVDFICFDAEDWGVPQWSDVTDNGDSWALGSQHWSKHPHKADYSAQYGILLDMVGGQGAQFYKEGMSLIHARSVVNRVWAAAEAIGYGSYFPAREGGMINDDHLPVNENRKIPTIDIIPYYPDCPQSSFGPTWHTVNDDMQHIDRNTLKAVGQTVIQVLYTTK